MVETYVARIELQQQTSCRNQQCTDCNRQKQTIEFVAMSKSYQSYNNPSFKFRSESYHLQRRFTKFPEYHKTMQTNKYE